MTRFLPMAQPCSRSSLSFPAGFLALICDMAPLQARTGPVAPVRTPISQARGPALSPDEARAIAKEAWLYAYAP
jgi:hypothetical protein